MIARQGRDFALLDEEEEVGTRERPLWPWLVAAGFVIVAIVAGFFVWHQLSSGGAKEPVALYVGEKVGSAERQIRNAHLVPVEKLQPCANQPPGHVCSQNPSPGTKVTKGGPVTLYVSTGKPKVAVPSVVGEPWTQAQQQLVQAGFKPVRKDVPGGKTKGVVSATVPAAGVMLAKGQTVRVNVTTGPAINQVPNVENESEAQAQSDLQNAGFNLVVAGYVNSTEPANYVVSQVPQPGQNAPQGSNVKVMLSKGPPQVTVPPVVNETSQEAVHDLEAAGFKVVQQPVGVSDPTQNNIVQSQNPAGGQSANKGSTVTIYVGQYSPGGPTTTG